MRLATFTHEGVTRIGVVAGNELVDLSSAAPDLPRAMVPLIAAGEPAREAARRAATAGSHRLPLTAVRLEAPIPRPPKFLATGLNYADHIAETGLARPEFPSFFAKQATCIVGPYDAIQLPRVSEQLDYEGELAFVIGRRCRHVPRERAHEVIMGYTIVNDVSVRDWQQRGGPLLGKSFDTHGPMGPWIVTADEVGDPNQLDIKTWVSGELRQESNTRYLINNCFDMVAILSTAMTLEPGDVIATGTPGGVALGMKPPRWLQVSDMVRIEIERIGAIENRVVAEPANGGRIA